MSYTKAKDDNIEQEVLEAIARLKEYGNTVIKDKYYKKYTTEQLEEEFKKRGALVHIIIKKMTTPVSMRNYYNDGSWISRVVYLDEIVEQKPQVKDERDISGYVIRTSEGKVEIFRNLYEVCMYYEYPASMMQIIEQRLRDNNGEKIKMKKRTTLEVIYD